jgi:hypothetical protein
MSIRTTSLRFPSHGLLSRCHLTLNSELLLFYCLCAVRDWGHLAHWSLFGPLYQPWMMDDGWWEVWNSRWIDWKGKPIHSEQTFPSATSYPQKTDLTWSGLETGPPQCKSGGERTSRHWILLSRQMQWQSELSRAAKDEPMSRVSAPPPPTLHIASDAADLVRDTNTPFLSLSSNKVQQESIKYNEILCIMDHVVV